MTKLSSKEFVQGYKNTSSVLNYVLTEASKNYSVEDSVDEVCELRKYPEDTPMRDTLKELGLVWSGDGSYLTKPIVHNSFYGVFNNDGFFLMKNRYMLPIKDVCGKTIALVGWDREANLKYMTTKSKYFRKELDFFGQETLLNRVGKSVIVEGIFDTLHARSYGIETYGAMGLSAGPKKQALYAAMGKIVGIPDDDTGGDSVRNRDRWGLSRRRGSGYVNWTELKRSSGMSNPEKVKGMDLDSLLAQQGSKGAEAVKALF